MLLHKRTAPEDNKTLSNSQNFESEELSSSRDFVKKLLKESLHKLQEEEAEGHIFTRWELGACWIQHLQDQNKTEKDKKLSGEKTKNVMKVEGLGTPLRSLKNKKKNVDGTKGELQSKNLKSIANGVNGEVGSIMLPLAESQLETNANENELALRRLLTDAAFTRLKESETGLHCKVVFSSSLESYNISCLFSKACNDFLIVIDSLCKS